jgi:hypothetical protein
MEEVFNFLVRISGFQTQYTGAWLLTIAKTGHLDGIYGTANGRFHVTVQSNFHDVVVAQRIATETGLILPGGTVNSNLVSAKAFAVSFDKQAH